MKGKKKRKEKFASWVGDIYHYRAGIAIDGRRCCWDFIDFGGFDFWVGGLVQVMEKGNIPT